MSNSKKNKSKVKRIRIYSIISILAIILVFIAGGYIYINKTLDKVENIEVNPENIGINTETKEEFKEISNIALLGIDSRDNDLVGRKL